MEIMPKSKCIGWVPYHGLVVFAQGLLTGRLLGFADRSVYLRVGLRPGLIRVLPVQLLGGIGTRDLNRSFFIIITITRKYIYVRPFSIPQ